MSDFDPESFTRESRDQWNKAAPHYRKIADVLNETQTHRMEEGIALPYEVVMAKGLRP